jgi:hypothetical protein
MALAALILRIFLSASPFFPQIEVSRDQTAHLFWFSIEPHTKPTIRLR